MYATMQIHLVHLLYCLLHVCIVYSNSSMAVGGGGDEDGGVR